MGAVAFGFARQGGQVKDQRQTRRQSETGQRTRRTQIGQKRQRGAEGEPARQRERFKR
jgi:hypothetical protein